MPSRSNLFERPRKQKTSPANSLLWVFDPLEQREDYACRKMFGCDAAYLGELLCLVVADRGDPWNGLLVCTAKEQHAALMDDMPALRPHPVLGKWLYIAQDDEAFEETAASMTRLVLDRDPRVGVESRRRPRKKAGGMRQ
jgi:hypothetical protein